MNGLRAPWHSARWLTARSPASATAVLLAVLLTTQATSAQQVELKRKYREGDDYRYLQTQTSHSSTPAGDITQTTSRTTREQVVSVAADGTSTVRMTYESVRTVQDSPLGHSEYDSKNGPPRFDATNPSATIMDALVGKTSEVTIGPDGRAVRTTGMESAREEMLASVAVNNPALADRMRQSMAAAGPEGLPAGVSVQGQSLPDHPVAPGDSWSTDVSMGTGTLSTMRVLHTYTLREVISREGRRIAKVDIAGNMLREMSTAAPMGPMAGDVTGEMDFDLDRGITLRSVITTIMNIELMGQSMRTESTITNELIP